jgi:hypothetical protein
MWEMVENNFLKLLLDKIKYVYKIRKFCAKFSDEALSEPIQINKVFREECGHSSILLYMYSNNIIHEFKVVI